MSRFTILLCLFVFQLAAVSLPPAPLQNYAPVVIVNNTTLPSNQIYVIFYGQDANGFPCFLIPNLSTGVCTYGYVTPSGTPSSAGSSVTLDQLPTATGTGQTNPAYLMYLPLTGSSRGYLSIGSPMYLQTAFDPKLGLINISAASPSAYNDPNFYTLNTFVEFVYETVSNTSSGTEIFLDLSYVDYFSLPLQLAAYSYPSNTQIIAPNPPVITPTPPTNILSVASGTAASSSTNPAITREDIINQTIANLTSGQTYPSWGNLGVPYYANQYTDTTPLTYLRILSAKNSISLGQGTGFKMPAVPLTYFPANYVQSTTNGINGLTLMQAAWQHYTNTANTLYSQVYPQSQAPTIYAISSVAGSISGPLTLQFVDQTNHPPQTVMLDLLTLTTEQLLSGSVWPFYPGSVSAAYTNELSKLISSLFGIGQFPSTGIPTSLNNPFSNSTIPDTGTTQAFTSYSYFNNPRGFGNTGPWYNLYDPILHTQMVSAGALSNNPSLGQGYAYDYDDLLGMSGTISGMYVQDQYGNPAQMTPFNNTNYLTCQPYFVLSLESLNGTTIPNIANDTYSYDVTIDAATGPSTVSFTWYDMGGMVHNTPAPTMGTTHLGTVYVTPSQPFTVTFTFNGGLSPFTHTYKINLLRQIVTPNTTTSTFSATDAHYLDGVTFNVTGTATAPKFEIAVDSSAPPWPG